MIDLYRARFGDLAAGYESFYLRACRPGGGLGVWIRYTVHRRSGAEPAGSLWFTLFEEHGPTAAKVTAPGPESGGPDWIRVAGGRIGPGAATGSIGDVAWQLRFRGEDPLPHLPSGWMYRAPVPRTKPVSLHPLGSLDGTLSVAGRTIELAGWPGMVGHNWGTEHAERWIWLHGMGFGGWLDVVLARIKVAGRVTPWIANGAVSMGGHRFRLGGPRRAVVSESPDGVEFTLPGKGFAVSGAVRAPRRRFVGWRYADPDGAEHDVVNCSIADLELSVPGKQLRVAGQAAYELGMREHDHGMTIQPFGDG